MSTKKLKKREALRLTVENAVIRDEENRRIRFSAEKPITQVLKKLDTTLCGLDIEEVAKKTQYIWKQQSNTRKEKVITKTSGRCIY